MFGVLNLLRLMREQHNIQTTFDEYRKFTYKFTFFSAPFLIFSNPLIGSMRSIIRKYRNVNINYIFNCVSTLLFFRSEHRIYLDFDVRKLGR